MGNNREGTLSLIRKTRLVAILRGVPEARAEGAVAALISGGVRVLEFTFDHTKADCVEKNTKQIRRAVETFGDRAVVGCGTCLTAEEAEAAYAAGAALVVTPNVNEAVIRRARELGMAVMAGAMTPTEIEAAWRCGADIVKLFPAGALGLSYIRAVRCPLEHIPLFAVGGVQPENVADFLSAGIGGFGVGGPLVLKDAVQSGDFSAVARRAKAFTGAIAAWEASHGA